MDINIEQLDGEEKSKIKALIRERNDKDRDKGIEYIFRQSDDKDQYLCGKKLDPNQMVKDDKALMGESESEFKERMEHRKLLEKMREDPISIIHFNDLQARKIAMEKKRVHDKLNDKNKLRNRRMSSSSDSDSVGSTNVDKLISIIADGRDDFKEYIKNNTDLIRKPNEGKTNAKYNHNTKEKYSDHSRQRQISRSRSRGNNRREHRGMKRNTSKSPDNDRYVNRKPITSRIQDNRKRSTSNNNRKRSKSRDMRKRSTSRHNSKRSNHIRNRSRSRDYRKKSMTPKENNYNANYSSSKNRTNYSKTVIKPKLSEEEKQRRLKEMEQNAHEHQLRCELLDKKFHRENEKEAKEIEKQMKNHDLVILNNTIKMNQECTLEQSLSEGRKQAMVKKIFKK